MPAYFISFEGPEGAGKTTLIKMVEEELVQRGLEVVSTREPGGIAIAEEIRSVILDTKNTAMDSRTEALLYAAARSQHLAEKVLPALDKGKIVLCDRFIDSSLAYQGHARGLGIDKVFAINEFAIHGRLPDLTIYFDLDPKVGMERISANKNREVNRLDNEKLDFHYKVKEGYEILLGKYPERIKSVNADLPIENVFRQVMGLIEGSL